MTAVFQDLQRPDNPLNGSQLIVAASLLDMCRSLKGRKPFLFELRGDNGFMLTIGFAGNVGSVQHSPCDGSPPYLMAISDEHMEDSKCLQFLAGDTPTPIPLRFCLPIAVVERIAHEFIEGGRRSEAVNWEEI